MSATDHPNWLLTQWLILNIEGLATPPAFFFKHYFTQPMYSHNIDQSAINANIIETLRDVDDFTDLTFGRRLGRIFAFSEIDLH